MNVHTELSLSGLLAVGFFALSLPAQAQPCERGEPRPLLGIGTFHCQGGICKVQGATARFAGSRPPRDREGRRFSYDFSVEPSLWNIDSAGPAADKLEEGDVLVAVNGYAITSVPASEELERLEAGRPVLLQIRRASRLLEVNVTPTPSCNRVMVSAGSDARPFTRAGAWAARDLRSITYTEPVRQASGQLSAPGNLGIAITCGECVLTLPSRGEPARFRFKEYPTVDSVIEGGPADRAGLLPGDVLTHVDGTDLVGEHGGNRLSRLRGGETVEIRYLRDGRAGTVIVQLDPGR